MNRINCILKTPVALLLMGLMALPFPAWGSPETARLDGAHFKNSADGALYAWQLVTDGFGRTGDVIEVKLSVSKGVNYALATGRDNFISNMDAYVYAEEGQLLTEDRDPRSRAFVSWCAQYSGTATAYVHIRATMGVKPGSYSVWLGSLEMAKRGEPVKEAASGN